MNEKALKTLEYTKIIDQLTECLHGDGKTDVPGTAAVL